MRIAEVAKLFVGSCVVYVVVAACSAYSADEPAASSSGGSSGTTGGDGAPDSPSIVDPVGNALAEGHKSGTRLKLRFYEGSDGSRQFINFFDTMLQTPCNVPVTTADGKVRCAPSGPGQVFFSDTECKTPSLFDVAKTTDPQPKYAVVKTANATAGTYYALGALVTPPAKAYVSFGIGLGCSQVDVPTTDNIYAIGTPVPDTTFVEMTIKNE